MKKLILLLALISSIAFGIEKKTPSGGTVKDKPGKSQSSDNIVAFIAKDLVVLGLQVDGFAIRWKTIDTNKGGFTMNANSDRIYVPSAGTYIVLARVGSSTADIEKFLNVMVNGVSVVYGDNTRTANDHNISAHTLVEVPAGGYISVGLAGVAGGQTLAGEWHSNRIAIARVSY